MSRPLALVFALALFAGCSSDSGTSCNQSGCHLDSDCNGGQRCVFTHATDCAGTCFVISNTSESCSSSGGVSTCIETVRTDVLDAGSLAGCPTNPTSLTGTADAGSACTNGEGCKPVCCACDGGTPVLAAECDNGACADRDTTCAAAAGMCPE